MAEVFTHRELVYRASTWLSKNGHQLVMTEIAVGREIPDAIGWKAWKWSTLIECKVSRADFLKDSKKLTRKNKELAVGQRRFYLTPKGLLKPEELPSGWGLLELSGNKVTLIKKPTQSPYNLQIAANELSTVLSLLRRCELRGVKFTESYTEFCRWKENNPQPTDILLREDK